MIVTQVDRQMNEETGRARETAHKLEKERNRYMNGQVVDNKQAVDRSIKEKFIDSFQRARGTNVGAENKAKLSYSSLVLILNFRPTKAVDNPWPRKVQCFQENYMTQGKMNEFCF